MFIPNFRVNHAVGRVPARARLQSLGLKGADFSPYIHEDK
jgi:hypothetical protein